MLKENKGSGFGLMNCKGIIEKYKKTNDLFRGCVLMWRVNWGREAVFIFVCLRECVKQWGYCCFACCFRWMVSCLHDPIPPMLQDGDSIVVVMDSAYEDLLDVASDYANALFC